LGRGVVQLRRRRREESTDLRLSDKGEGIKNCEYFLDVINV